MLLVFIIAWMCWPGRYSGSFSQSFVYFGVVFLGSLFASDCFIILLWLKSLRCMGFNAVAVCVAGHMSLWACSPLLFICIVVGALRVKM